MKDFPPSDNVTAPPIAIVGLGALFPGRGDTVGYWRDILEGVDAIGDVPPTHWLIDDYYDPDPAAPDKTYGKRGGFLSPRAFDPMAFGVPPTALSATDTAQLLALIVAKEALAQAQATTLNAPGVDLERTSVVLGVASATELVAHMSNRLQRPVWVKAMREAGLAEGQVQTIADAIADHYVPWQEATFPGLLGNVVAGRVANRLDLGGANYVTDAACASSLSALHVALHELYAGTSDTVLAGGVDALNDILMYMCFSKTPALSPTGDCRPFSAAADGTMLGEGVGMAALRRLEDAERDGNQIYAVIRGIGAGSDGRATAIYAPRAGGQARALRRAYDAAGYSPSTVELVEAHGTGTKAGDAAEFEGLRQVFAPSADGAQTAPWCALGSVKSQIGHTKAAAGAASLIKTALALHHRVLPPTIKVDAPNPALGLADGPFYLNTKARPWVRGRSHPRRAAVSSFGFGGSNFHVTLEEYDGPLRAPRARALPSELVLLSAPDDDGLARALQAAVDAVATDDDLARFADMTHAAFDAHAARRLAIVAASAEDFHAKLKTAARAGSGAPLPADIAYGAGAPVEGAIAFLFPGQGSQYVDMGCDLALAFEDARRVWDAAADHPDLRDAPLHALTFPTPKFTREEAEADSAALTRMENAQPALAATSLSMLALLDRLCLGPDMTGGHSFGEVTALCAAGAFDAATALSIARRRGQAMADAAAGAEGAMLATTLDRAAAEAVIAETGAAVVVANDNAPGQTVLSGAGEAIAAVEAALAARGVTARRLPVASAFHSAIVAGAVAPFRAVLDDAAFTRPTAPVFANAEAAPYPDDADAARDLLAGQLARPVRFREQLLAMHAAGARVFIEVGAGSVLTRLVEQTLGEQTLGDQALAVALDAKRENGVTAFWRGLAKLAAAGVAFDVAALLADMPAPPAPAPRGRMAIDITGANVGKPYPPAADADPAPVREATPARAPAEPTLFAEAPAEPASPAPLSAPPLSPPTHETRTAMRDFDHLASPDEPEHASPRVHPDALAAIYADMAARHDTYVRALTEAHEAFLRATTALVSGATFTTAAPPAARPAPPAPVAPAPAPPVAPTAPAAPTTPITAAPAPATPKAAPPAAPASPTPVASTPVTDRLRAIVAEKTGYPEDMLEDGMDLEAELGIDSIKQVEILAALRDQEPNLPDVDPGQLGELRTIGQIAAFLGDAAPAPVLAPAAPVAAATPTSSVAAPTPIAEPASGGVADRLRAIVAEKTGYPEDMLEDGMDLEAELGIDSIKQVEILAALRDQEPNLPDVDPGQLGELRTIGQIAAFLSDAPAPGKEAAPGVPARSFSA